MKPFLPILTLTLCSCQNLVTVATLPNGAEVVNVAANLMGKQHIPAMVVKTDKVTITIEKGGYQEGENVPTKSIAKDALLGTISGVPGVVSSLDDVLQ